MGERTAYIPIDMRTVDRVCSYIPWCVVRVNFSRTGTSTG